MLFSEQFTEKDTNEGHKNGRKSRAFREMVIIFIVAILGFVLATIEATGVLHGEE